MRKFFRNQAYHLLGYLAIGAFLNYAATRFPGGDRPMWGLATGEWILISWLLAGIHQTWILFFWRMEFYFGRISAWMGNTGFLVYRIGFIVSALARLLLVIPISHATAHTLAIPDAVSNALIFATTPPILWGIYSVVFYFGLNRAFGADHFDPAYRSRTLETRGIFKYIPNAMYTIVFLLVYHPGLFWRSGLGVITAAAHHALVWFHYFCTEKPDLGEIYGRQGK